MYHKLKNTLVGLAVAVTMIGVSYSVGQPPAQPTASIEQSAPASGSAIEQLEALRDANSGMRSQLSMPFFSFAPLLPRGES